MAEGVNLGSAYGSIQIDLSKLKTNLQAGGAELREFQRTADTSATQSARSLDKLKESATKVGLGLVGIAAAGLALIRSVAMTAARTQVLGTVLHQVGKNAGYSTAMLDATVNTIKKLGITTQEARTAVVSFIQAELDVAKAATLARVAQDLAVIAGQNSSQAFATLTQAIVSQETMLLRQYGIVKGLTEIYGDYAKAHGLVASALDETQKKQAFLDAILEAGAKAAGSYEAAMGDVGKQLTSLPRYFEEAKNALGVFYQGILGFGVKGLTALLKGFTNLEPGAQGAIAAVLGCVTVFGSLGSAALLAGPKIVSLVQGLATLGAVTLGAIGIVGLIVTAVVALVAASQAAAEAHRKESADLASSTDTYSVYRRRLDEAGAAAYGLSEALYELVKAQDASRQAAFAKELVDAGEGLVSLAEGANKWGAGVETMVEVATTAELALLRDRTSVMELGTALGMTGQVLIDYTNNVLALAAAEAKRRIDNANEVDFERQRATVLTDLMQDTGTASKVVSDHGAAMQKLATDYMAANKAAADLAKETGLSVTKVKELRDGLHYTDAEIKAYADDVKLTGGELDAMTESTGLTREQIIYLNEALGWGQQQIEDYAAALKEAQKQQLDLVDAWSDGLTGLKDYQDEVKTSAQDYQDALADLNKDAGAKLADIKKKWQNSLPDKTTVAERMKLQQDAWDEWALRMGALMDGVQGDQEQGWVDTLRAMTDGTALSLQAAGGNIQTWLANLQKAFYQNKLPDLVNKDAPAYKEWAAQVAIDQKAATDAVNTEAANRRAALQKERDEELAAQKAHYKDLLVQTALHIAEESGALKTWAEQTQQGPYVEFYSNADTVFDAIKNGMLGIDPVLAQLIGTTIPGLGTAFETATGVVKANALTIDDLMAPNFLTDLATTQQQVSYALSNLGSVTTMGPGAPTAGMGAPKATSWIDEVMGLDEIPAKAEKAFGPDGLSGKFTVAKDTASAEAKTLADNVKAAITSIPLDATPQFKALSTGWTTIIDAMSLKALAFRDNVIAMLKGIVDFVNTMSVSATISWSATGAPGFAAGGVVPGAAGAPMAATVHGGELILNPGQQAQLARMFGTSVRDLARSALAGGSAGGRAGTVYQTQFEQHFGDVVVRNREEAQQFGLDTSYGAMYRLRAVGLIR